MRKVLRYAQDDGILDAEVLPVHHVQGQDDGILMRRFFTFTTFRVRMTAFFI